MPHSHFRINTPHVINEVIDGEAVVINLATGDYYSLRGSGAFIWSAVEQLADAHEIAEALVAAGMPIADAEPAVRRLLGQLAAEGLVVPLEDDPRDHPSKGLVPPPAALDLPMLEKFTDMQDLILLDPVHEVDERGWPNEPSKL